MASVASTGAPSFPGVTRSDVDPRGLSLDTFPGIFDLIELRMEREDSLVSDRENEGYLLNPASSAPPSPLEGWFPIVNRTVERSE